MTTCDKPMLMPENDEAIRVFNLCKAQLIISFDGVVGIDLKAVKIAMDLMEVEDQLGCAEKVLAYAESLYQKESALTMDETPPEKEG